MIIDRPEWDYIPMTHDDKARQLANWNKSAQSLLERDGTQKDSRGQTYAQPHRIRQNPVLEAAIQDMRDDYYRLFDEKRHLMEHPEIQNHAVKLANSEYDLASLNHRNYVRLIERNYGLNSEGVEDILANADIKNPDLPEGLSKNDAMNIVGSIIGRSIRSYDATS